MALCGLRTRWNACVFPRDALNTAKNVVQSTFVSKCKVRGVNDVFVLVHLYMILEHETSTPSCRSKSEIR